MTATLLKISVCAVEAIKIQWKKGSLVLSCPCGRFRGSKKKMDARDVPIWGLFCDPLVIRASCVNTELLAGCGKGWAKPLFESVT